MREDDELQVLGAESKQKSRRRWVLGFLGFVATITIVTGLGLIVRYAIKGALDFDEELMRNDGLRPSGDTTIIPALQDAADSLLNDKLTEIDGLQGQVIVMEVQTGRILAMVGLERNFEGKFQPCRNFAYQQELGSVAKTASLLAALETGEVALTDTVDTGNGLWAVDNERYMKDHNWPRGGYGMMTFEQALEVSSNIGISKAVMRAFGYDAQAFLDQLAKMSYGQPDSIEGIEGLGKTVYSSPKDSDWVNRRILWHAIGYERLMAPIQMLTFYNAIANDGKMMRPRFVKQVLREGEVVYETQPEVIKEQIASPKAIATMQTILEHVVSQGLGRKAGSRSFKVAGKTGTAQVSQGGAGYKSGQMWYWLSFVGFFPADEPRYTCIVCLKKPGLPASGGGMAGAVFHQISEGVMSKYLKRRVEDAGDSTSNFVPDVKNGDMIATNYVLGQLGVKTAREYDSDKSKRGTVWGKAASDKKSVTLTEQKVANGIMPDVTGMGASDAVYLLESYGLKVRLSGVGRVKSQSIPFGAELKAGMTCNLNLQNI